MSAAFPRTTLRPGACIAAIAPSSPFPRDDFERGLARLRQRYDVQVSEGIHERTGYLAGSDARRLAELIAALEDDEVQAIFAARGGYGATRLLDRVPLPLVARARKLLVGFSDVSALHALWTRAGVGSLHAMMIAGLGRASDAQVERFVRTIEGAVPGPFASLHPIAKGSARGVLVGGNLAVLTALIGTPHALDVSGRVLFLEDVGERPYRVDRMLTTWLSSGALTRVAAIALGGFTDADPGPDGVRVEDVLAERLAGLGVPVVSGVPAGHIDDNLELPLGAVVEVRAQGSEGLLTFEEPVT